MDSLKRSACQRWVRGVKIVFYGLLSVPILVACILLVGMIPVNNDFSPAEDGITIFLVSNPVHVDLLLPVRTKTIDWRTQFPEECFPDLPCSTTHVAIGWGNKQFFIETPTWSDLRVATAARALLWRSTAPAFWRT